jgi:hypothetical protein
MGVPVFGRSQLGQKRHGRRGPFLGGLKQVSFPLNPIPRLLPTRAPRLFNLHRLK